MAALAAPYSPVAVNHSRASTEPLEPRPAAGHDAANGRPRRHAPADEADRRAGPCSFRQMTTGVECGCRAYWRSTTTYDCACGHHACYHDGDGRLSGLFASPEQQRQTASSLMNDIMRDAGHRSSMGPSHGLLPAVEPTVQPGASPDLGRAGSPVSQAGHAAGTPESYASTSYLPRLPSFINNHTLMLPELLSDNFGNEAAGLGLHLPPPETAAAPVTAHLIREEPTVMAGDSLARALRAYQPSLSNHDIPSTRHPSPEQDYAPTMQGDRRQASSWPPTANDLPTSMPPPVTTKQNVPCQQITVQIPSQQNSTPLPVFTPALTPSVDQSPPSFLAKEPTNLREVSICLSAVRKFLSCHGSELRGLGERLYAVEHYPLSFSQQPRDQDLVDKTDMIEARIIEIESKVDQHHRALSGGSGLGMKRHGDSEAGSMISGHTNLGDYHNMESRLQNLEERLEELHKNIPPSITRPVEIEVLLIPWGRDLRGLWVAPEKLKHQPFRMNSQESEEWTDTRNGRSSSHLTASLAVGSERGWTSQAIYDWAESTAEWLVPRACGVQSTVYRRLKSRGFVRAVVISRPGAKDIQAAITKAFGPTLRALNQQDLSGGSTDPGFFGLSAPFMPLRKVYASSRLQFLTKSEMVTSALWTWEFLTSGVVMKASGGARRLFVTHRDAYVQRGETEAAAWTWDRLRKLPRVASDDNMDLDAAEPYWDEHPILDAPPSVSTSFASHSERPERPRAAESIADAMDAENLALSEEEPPSSPSPTALFAPITPITNPSTQEVLGVVQPRPSTPHPYPSSGSFAVPPHASRTTPRRHARAASNPAVAAAGTSLIGRGTQMRSFSPSTEVASPAMKRTSSVRRFETPTNPLIASIPNFLPSPRTTRSSSDHKRRKVERDFKRAPTPVVPYATPYSGNWGAGSTSAIEGVGGASDDGEEWEGVGEDLVVCSNGGNAGNT